MGRMNEKTCRRIIISLSVVLICTITWLALLYRNGGDTALALELTQSELDIAIAGNARLASELAGSNETNNRLIKEQRESSDYQRELEEELEYSNRIIGELATTAEDLSEGVERVDDIAREYADLIRQGNEFIANGEE